MKHESNTPANTPASSKDDSVRKLFSAHPRQWHANRYVYPVISRRSGGLSIGVNLNPDKVCNFDCIYCQVDRRTASEVRTVDPARLRDELETMIRLALEGDLFAEPPFDTVPAPLRRIRDIAFSGDGEPTASPQFPTAVDLAAELRARFNLEEVKLRLITNATLLARPVVRKALAVLDAHNGEIWAKLDAGTEDYFRLVCRPHVSLATVLANILDAARVRPLVIQSLWMKIHGECPPADEIDAYAERLREILQRGGRLKQVQIYTTARQPTEPYVSSLSADQLNTIATRVRAHVDVPVSVY